MHDAVSIKGSLQFRFTNSTLWDLYFYIQDWANLYASISIIVVNSGKFVLNIKYLVFFI